MNIVHLITTIERGGAENQLLILCEEQLRIGNQVTVFYLKGKPVLEAAFTKMGVRSYKVAGNSLISQSFFFKRDLKMLKPDVVHAHLPRSELVATLSGTKIPLVVSRHNAEKFFNSAPRFISSFFARFSSKQSNAGIAISKSVRNFLIEANEIAKNKEFHVVTYGYNFTTENEEHVPSTHQTKHKLLAIGRLVPQKDYPTILRGLSMLASQEMDFEISVLGEGENRVELQKLSKELKLEKRVFWMGKVEDTKSFYKESDLFILASRYEGFGMVLVEAMDHSLPIVCASSPTAIEVLGENYPGLFEIGSPRDLAEKVSWALENSGILVRELDYRKRFFIASDMAQKVQEIYELIQVH